MPHPVYLVYLVTDQGIEKRTFLTLSDQKRFMDDEPAFLTFEEAANLSIQVLCERVKQLESRR